MAEPSCPECGAALSESGECQMCATAIADPSHRVRAIPGAPNIDGFSISGLLGTGGMGSVWLAEDLTLKRQVAIKVIRSSLDQDTLRERFVREARAMATIEDPNVVRLYSFGTKDDLLYLVMEYVRGESLAEIIRRRGPLPVEEVCRVGIQISQGLRCAASKGVVHRDVKPGNILLDETDTIRVADFGLAKQQPLSGVENGALTMEGTIVGTPYYMPPEQAEGREFTSASDVYSLGLVLFEMLTGERPFSGNSPLAVIAKQLHEQLPELKGRRAPRQLERLLRRMTEKDPDARPAFDEVIASLEKILMRKRHEDQQVRLLHVVLVVMFAGGAFTAGVIASRVLEQIGPVKTITLVIALVAFGFAWAMLMIPGRYSLRASPTKRGSESSVGR